MARMAGASEEVVPAKAAAECGDALIMIRVDIDQWIGWIGADLLRSLTKFSLATT